MSIGQVRLIFRLPALRATKSNEETQVQTLAYVEWFTEMKTPDSDLRLFQVKRSTHNRQPRVSIIPIERIVQTVHLYPKLPTLAHNVTWSSTNVYEKASSFYVNPFLRHLDFVRFADALAL